MDKKLLGFKNVIFGHTLQQYEKKYRHRRDRLIVFTRKEILDYDKYYKLIKYNEETKKKEYTYWLFTSKKWWYIEETDCFYEVPKPIRLLWFINLNVFLHAAIPLLITGGIVTSIVVPLYYTKEHKSLGTVVVEGEKKDNVTLAYNYKQGQELDIQIEAKEDNKKVYEIEKIKVKDNNGERELKVNEYTIIETDKGLDIKIAYDILKQTEGYVVITVVPSVIEEQSSLVKIVLSNEKEYYADEYANYDDFVVTGYYSNSTTKKIIKGYSISPNLPYKFTIEDSKIGVNFQVTYSGKTSNLLIKPKVHATSVTLDQHEIKLLPDEEKTLKATVLPTEATNKEVTWNSSDPTIASVSENGVVKGLKVGSVTITATTVDGGYKDTCLVNIDVKHVTSVALDQKEVTITSKGSVTLIATVLPEDAFDKSVKWVSSDPTVATVDDNGVVKGIKDGKTTITVTTNDGGYTDTCSVTVDTPIIYHTVKFMVNGTQRDSVQVLDGNKVSRPKEDPVETDYIFEGWVDKDSKEFDFNTSITSDLTLNAKLEENYIEYEQDPDYTGQKCLRAVKFKKGKFRNNLHFPRTMKLSTLGTDVYTVTSIASGFYTPTNLYDEDTSLWSIFISKTIKTILSDNVSQGAFDYNGYLNNIEFEEGSEIETIDNWAFKYCSRFPHGTITAKCNISKCSKLKTIGQYCFDNNSNIYFGELELPETLEKIDTMGFNYSPGITKLKVHKKLMHYGNNTFADSANITEVDFSEYDDPTNLPINYGLVFRGCNSLTTIYVKNDNMKQAFSTTNNWKDYASLYTVKE